MLCCFVSQSWPDVLKKLTDGGKDGTCEKSRSLAGINLSTGLESHLALKVDKQF